MTPADLQQRFKAMGQRSVSHAARRNFTADCSIPSVEFDHVTRDMLVLISFSHGYSAILAAKLMNKLDLT